MESCFYLLPKLFENIAWSSEEVSATTLVRIDELGKTYSLLPLLSDIDYEEDWEKYGWEI